MLAAALLEQGHRRFAVLRGPGTVVTAADRTTGFVSALEQSGVEPVVVIETTFDRDGGFDGARQLVRQGLAGSDPLCVFATNDAMAMGAMAAFREAGLDIPQEVQVAGFDDIPTLRSDLRDHFPGLTTVRLPLEAMGQRIVEMAMSTDARPGAAAVERVPAEVILRDSTRLPKHPLVFDTG